MATHTIEQRSRTRRSQRQASKDPGKDKSSHHHVEKNRKLITENRANKSDASNTPALAALPRANERLYGFWLSHGDRTIHKLLFKLKNSGYLVEVRLGAERVPLNKLILEISSTLQQNP